MRRLFVKSMSPVVGSTAVRTMFVFSQQSKILQDNQKTLKSDSNVWLEDWEVQRLNVKAQGNPTIISLEKSLELFNFSDLETPPDAMEMPVHTSFASQKPYGRKLQLELSDRAAKKGFTSKYWIPVGTVRKQNYTLRQNARPTVVLSGGTVKLFHVSQLENGEQLARYPVSGGTRRPYNSNSIQFQLLSENVLLNNYQTGLYFTKKQMDALKLRSTDGATPVKVDLPSDINNALQYYNLDQLELPEAALAALNRTEPDVPSFLLSGEPVRNKESLPKHFTSNFWLSSRDAKLYEFAIKDSERSKGTVLSSRVNTLEMFHAEQMTAPDDAYRVAGHYVV